MFPDLMQHRVEVLGGHSGFTIAGMSVHYAHNGSIVSVTGHVSRDCWPDVVSLVAQVRPGRKVSDFCGSDSATAADAGGGVDAASSGLLDPSDRPGVAQIITRGPRPFR